MPRYITEIILYAWALYFFIKEKDYKLKDYKQFKNWANFLKGAGLILCGKLIAIYFSYLLLQSNVMGTDIDSVDGLLATLLFVVSIIIIAKILNKKDRLHAEDDKNTL